MRTPRARVAAGALMIGIPASAAAVPAGVALGATGGTDVAGPPGPGTPLEITLQSRQIAFGHDVVVTGAAPAGDTVQLEFEPAGDASGWREVSSATATSSGRFRLGGPLERSGAVEAVDSSTGSYPSMLSLDGTSAGTATSAAQLVEVKAAVRVGARQIGVLTGQTVVIRGRLLPALPGRKLALVGLQDGTWRTLATARTGDRGTFRLRYATGAPGRESIRVRFAGDEANARSAAQVGQLTVYREADASWYDDAGDTACGFHAYFGVANRTLPCGTKVALRYNGRSVTATVDDRGPYVAGRDWDLNQNTAAALGFGGVGILWSSE
jgi:rare lipoprotein A